MVEWTGQLTESARQAPHGAEGTDGLGFSSSLISSMSGLASTLTSAPDWSCFSSDEDSVADGEDTSRAPFLANRTFCFRTDDEGDDDEEVDTGVEEPRIFLEYVFVTSLTFVFSSFSLSLDPFSSGDLATLHSLSRALRISATFFMAASSSSGPASGSNRVGSGRQGPTVSSSCSTNSPGSVSSAQKRR